MIFRAVDCFAHGHVHEPITLAFIDADSSSEAYARLKTALSATWSVTADEVDFSMPHSEDDLFRSSTMPASAGDRRLVSIGSWGDIPIYDEGVHVLLFLNDAGRRRIGHAYDAARKHEQEIAALIEASTTANDEARALAERLRDRGGLTWRGGPIITRENKELLRIAGLLELVQQQTHKGQRDAARENFQAARDRLTSVIMGEPA